MRAEVKVWYEINPLRNRIGVITDQYGEFLEIRDLETGEYVLKHKSKIEPVRGKSAKEKAGFLIE